MAYFPRSIMPNNPKRDAPGTGTILAGDFNRHTSAIIDIETFLGTGPASEQDIIDILEQKVAPKNFVGAIGYLIDSVNLLLGGGTLATSGYVHSGQRMIFPSSARTVFLSSPPAPTDTEIKVNTTVGFPDSGVISILNDVSTGTSDSSLVEWIRYSGRTSASFLGCERGSFGTTAGAHAGNPALPQTYVGASNLRDQCINLPIGYQICNRRYPGWRLKTGYGFEAFGLAGELVEITKQIRQAPGRFPIDPAVLGTSFNNVTVAAQGAGILVTLPTGELILQSADAGFRAAGQLSWTEANLFVSNLQGLGLIVALHGPGDWQTGNAPFVPVFQGAMSVSHALAGVTINSSVVGTATPVELQTLDIIQTADGRLVITSVTNSDQRPADEAIIQYKTFFVASATTSVIRNTF